MILALSQAPQESLDIAATTPQPSDAQWAARAAASSGKCQAWSASSQEPK